MSARPETLHFIGVLHPGSSQSLSRIQASAVILSSLYLRRVSLRTVSSVSNIMICFSEKKTLHSRKKVLIFSTDFLGNSIGRPPNNSSPSLVNKVNKTVNYKQ